MSDLFWLANEQMSKFFPSFPKSHGKPRGDDRRVLSEIVYITKKGCTDKTFRKPTDRTRSDTAGESVGARKASSPVMVGAAYPIKHRTATRMTAAKAGGARLPDQSNQGRHK